MTDTDPRTWPVIDWEAEWSEMEARRAQGLPVEPGWAKYGVTVAEEKIYQEKAMRLCRLIVDPHEPETPPSANDLGELGIDDDAVATADGIAAELVKIYRDARLAERYENADPATLDPIQQNVRAHLLTKGVWRAEYLRLLEAVVLRAIELGFGPAEDFPI